MSILIPYISFETPYPSMDDRGMLMLDLIIPTHVNLESRRRRGCNPRVWNPGFTAWGSSQSSNFIYVLAYSFQNIWSSHYKCLGPPKNRIIFQHILQLKQIYGWFPHDLCPKIWFSVAFSHEHDDFPIFVYSSPKKPTDFFSGIPTIASWRPSRLRLGEPPQGRCQAGCLTAGYWGLLQLDISKLSGGRTMPWIVTNSDYNIIVVI